MTPPVRSSIPSNVLEMVLRTVLCAPVRRADASGTGIPARRANSTSSSEAWAGTSR